MNRAPHKVTIYETKSGKPLTCDPVDAREHLAAPGQFYTATDPNAKPDKPVKVVLMGSSQCPEKFDLGPKKVSLAEVVASAVEARGPSAEAWNAMGDKERGDAILEHVEVMKAQAQAAALTAQTAKAGNGNTTKK